MFPRSPQTLSVITLPTPCGSIGSITPIKLDQVRPGNKHNISKTHRSRNRPRGATLMPIPLESPYPERPWYPYASRNNRDNCILSPVRLHYNPVSLGCAFFVDQFDGKCTRRISHRKQPYLSSPNTHRFVRTSWKRSANVSSCSGSSLETSTSWIQHPLDRA